MTFSDITTALLACLPHRITEWEARDSELGEYADAGALTCFLLDELVQQTPIASALGMELERLYQLADDAAKEVLRIGIFEEMCLVLHIHWDAPMLYEQKRDLVLGHLGPIAKEIFTRYDSEAWKRA